MKRFLCLMCFFYLSQTVAFSDPCTNIPNINCGTDVQFNASGLGDPAYPNGMNGQGCSSGTAQGGQETIYRFTVPATGTYQLNTTLANGQVVDYYYKENNNTCNNTGWTCINRVGSAGAAMGAFNWIAGDVILFLLNAEGTGTTTQSFKINCATDICSAITSITCGTAVSFNSVGFGDPSYPNGMNGQGCSSGTAQGGQETIYRFTVPATGTYQLNTTLANGQVVDYYYKENNNTCNNTGWTCINRVGSAGAAMGAFNWIAGDVILFLLNAEGTGTTTQSFKINCATDICSAITSITCGTAVSFNSVGFGDPSYPNGMNGQGCSSGTAQGGQETIYRFTVPATGTYQLNTTLANGQVVDYYYKENNNTCNNTGWTCINRTGSAGAAMGAFNWTAGDIILFLLNAEGTGTTTQSFKINCATDICSAIVPVTCGTAVSFNAVGFGDPAYPNGMNGQGCSNNQTNQGGQETIYRFTVPATGTYQLNTTLANGQVVDYYYKENNNTCNNTGWTCINRTGSAGAAMGAFNWTAGDIILFLLNAEGTGTTTQSFKINCATDICSAIVPVTCGTAVSFNAVGFGDPAYPNGMNGQGCSNNQTNQGGQETIYRFTVPATGTYQLNTTLANGQVVDYYYKENNNTCNNTGWTCINRTGSAGAAMGAFNWIAGDIILFLLNAEGTGTTTQSFKINCATDICSAIVPVTCGTAVSFNAVGFGDPAYPNGMNGQGCSNNQTNQGGQETIYRLVVTSSGTFQINTTLANGQVVDYYYKLNNIACVNTGWTCITRTGSANALLGSPFNWNTGDTILLLLNAESTGTTTQSFKINCAQGGSLPIRLLSFDVNNFGIANKLSWITSSEINFSQFIVEHSTDGINFTNIGQIGASGNTNTNKSYQFFDKNPNNGVNYYRLKMVDIDTKFTYSKVVRINVLSKYSFNLSPNPAKDNLNVQVYREAAEQVSVKIVDIQGRTLYHHNQQLQNGTTSFPINTSALPGGLYRLVITGRNVESRGFVKE